MNTPHVTEESGAVYYDFLKPKVAKLEGWTCVWADGWTERTAWDAAMAECDEFIASNFPTAKHEGVGYWRVPRQYHITYNQGRVIVRKMGSRD